jgi:GNAT superfamily N-acetyltransferase
VRIAWYDGPRLALWDLFELADDSSEQIDGYIELGRVLAAFDDADEVVGHVQLVDGDRAGAVELRSIAVREELQGRGIGRQLVERALALCRDEGKRAVSVTTATADIDNLRFYQRLGFRASSVTRDAFTEAQGYPPQLEANGIPVRDSITFTVQLGPA